MKVDVGVLFAKEVLNFPDDDRKKIKAFIDHLKANDFSGLEGRNKSSDNVPTDDRDFVNKVKVALQYRLWHYHIGIDAYDMAKPFGDRTSEYVLHYMNELTPGEIKIVDFSSHPPFRPPTPPYLI